VRIRKGQALVPMILSDIATLVEMQGMACQGGLLSVATKAITTLATTTTSALHAPLAPQRRVPAQGAPLLTAALPLAMERQMERWGCVLLVRMSSVRHRLHDNLTPCFSPICCQLI